MPLLLHALPPSPTDCPLPACAPPLPLPQELEGAFMIAFERAGDAVEWCLMLQELMMEVRGGACGGGEQGNEWA